MADKQQTKWLSVDQTAKLLGVSRDTIMRRLHTNEIPHIRLGRLYRIHPGAIRDMEVGNVKDGE